MFGAEAATGTPRYSSIRCLAKVAACAELPRAQVTTTRGRPAVQASDKLRDRQSQPIGLAAHRIRRLAQLSRHAHVKNLSHTVERLLLKRCEPAIGGARLPGEMGEMSDMMETERP